MSKRHWIIVAATLGGSQYAQAQKDTASKQLDEVVVTANKFPQKESTTGKVITVVSREQLERNSGRTIAQVLNEQAGIIVNGAQGNPGGLQTVFMRGAGSANTLILVDGVPANDPTGTSSEFDINHFSIDQVERIEILKGAQSVLYGSDAVAGVINIITRKQVSSKPIGFNAGIAGGSYGTVKGNAGVSGKAGLITYNGQYTHLQSDGFSAATDTTGKQHFDRDGINQDDGSLNIGAQLSSNWKLRAFGSYSQYKTGLDAGAFTDETNYNLISKNLQAGLASVTQFGKNAVNVNLNLNNTERNLKDSATFGDYKGKTLFAEAFTNLYLCEHAGLLAGVDYKNQKADINSTYDVLGSDSLHINQVSAYASLLLKSLGGFNVELGGRYTHHSQFGSNFTYSFNPSYTINRQVKLFANIASGFRAPSLYNIASEYGNRNLVPEKSMSYEVGLQYVNTANTIDLRGTFFARDIKDVIVFNATAVPPYGQYGNADEQKDKGFELEAVVRPAPGLSITANYAYVDGKIHTQVNGKDTSESNLYKRPKNAVNATIGYQATRKLFTSIGLRFVGSRQDQFYNTTNYTSQVVSLPSYYNLNVYGAYQVVSALKIFVDLQNITDQKYYETYGFNSRKFNFMTGVSVNF